MSIAVVGFDSAWTDSAKSPGAICCVEVDDFGKKTFLPPALSTFDEAVRFIRGRQAGVDLCLVTIDQPTIVNNVAGCRPVERVVASAISFVGGGVQPANRSKASVFGEYAPIWRFKSALDANDDPIACLSARNGLFLAEVFPAFALLSYNAEYWGRMMAPKYNPANKKKFKIEDWQSVARTVAREFDRKGVPEANAWADLQAEKTTPTKADQDRLDSQICALIGLGWLFDSRNDNVMIGDTKSGYIVSPCCKAIRTTLAGRADKLSVDFV